MESLGDILKRLTPKHSPENGNVSSIPEEEISNACPICQDRGWVRAQVSMGDPLFGKAIICRCRAIVTDEDRFERLKRYSDLGLLGRFTLDDIDPKGNGQSPEDERLYRKAYQSASEYASNPQGWLVLSGPSGCGKTVLAAATANRCMAAGYPALFVVVPDLLDHLRAGYNPTGDMLYDEQFERVRSVPLLILDDLGSQSSTPWAQEKLYQILNHRFNNQLPTIVTLGVPFEVLEDRLGTRLTDPKICVVLQLSGYSFHGLENIGSPEPQLLMRSTFESFDGRGNGADSQGVESLEAALRASKEFVHYPEGWLVLTGVNGCGKTHLAVAIYKESVRMGKDAYFFFLPDLLDHFRFTFSPDSRVTYSELFQRVRNVPMLILDDLGAQSSTPWAQEKLYQIIVHRHNARLPTVMTTTVDPDSLSGPVGSRLKDSTLVQVIPITAPDYRDKATRRPRRNTGTIRSH
jgi:DNA replication protein DnaC